MGATKTAPCTVSLDREKLSAFIVFRPDATPEIIFRRDLVHTLSEANVKFTPGLEKRIDSLAALLQQGKLPTEPVLMARGRPADAGDNARFELNPDLLNEADATQEDNRVNWYEQHQIVTVGKDQVVGVIHPVRPSATGEDVCGQVIKPQARRAEVALGSNVRLAEDGRTVVATCDGRVDYGPLKVAVLDVLLVAGDVDFNSGNLDSASDVLVRGSILDLFRVRSRKSIEVAGNIEAAQVRADGNILVRGGICGKEKGCVTCGGELRAKFCDSVRIECSNDVFVAREAINCIIQTNGSIHIASGSLIGGRTHTRNGGEIKVLGSGAGVKTHIGIGMNIDALGSIKEIDEKAASLRATAEKIRAGVKPLLDTMRRLTPLQRQKATELVFQADDLDSQAESLAEQKARLLAETSPVEGASLLVSGKICEGVSITVDNYSLRFENEHKGPIRIEKRKIKNVTEIVGVNQLSGSIQVFPARKIDLPELDQPAS
jgi:uncharacterized protein (DUF342 family)